MGNTSHCILYLLSFEEFVRDNEAVRFGDNLLSRRLSSGYNFASFEQFPLNSPDSLIFYGIYAQRHDHLGEVIALMERENIIKEGNVTFGIMGTKILGDYKDKEPVSRDIKMSDGSVLKTMESVEALLIFCLDSEASEEDRKIQAARIGAFLISRAPRILGRYKDPNTRATLTSELREALISVKGSRFKQALSNVFYFASGNLVALKQRRPLVGRDIQYDTYINSKLFRYLTSYRVNP